MRYSSRKSLYAHARFPHEKFFSLVRGTYLCPCIFPMVETKRFERSERFFDPELFVA